MARDLVREDYPDAVIEIVDTLAAAGGEGYLTILAAEARDSGKIYWRLKILLKQ